MKENTKALVSDGIEGWLDPICAKAIDSLLLLQFEYNVRGDLGEIGVYHGKTLAHLVCHRREGEKTFGVDPFVIKYRNGTTEDFFEKAKKNISALNDTNTIHGETVLYKGISTDREIVQALSTYESKARVISIDGSHAFNDVLSDLTLCTDLISDDGILIVDDFCNSLNPEVTFALYEFLTNNSKGKSLKIVLAVSPKCSPRYGSSRIFLQKKSSKISYREPLLKKLQDCLSGCMTAYIPILGDSIPVIFPE